VVVRLDGNAVGLLDSKGVR